MMGILNYFRRLRSRQVVRPWALCAPVVVLLIALPMLRPLRAPGDVSENELSRLATIEALVERDTLVIGDTEAFKALRNQTQRTETAAWVWTQGDPVPGTIQGRPRFSGEKAPYYSDKPPVLAFLLSGAYELMHKLGWTFASNPAVVAYVLTMLGVTLPVAGAAGLIYRMGRVFELKRPLRTALALGVALGSGLIGYATVLNSHAPAAALVITASACLLHVAASRKPSRGGGWLAICGFCAALAAVIDLSALVFLGLLMLVIPAIRWHWGMRIGGVLLYAIGAAPPLVLHVMLTLPVTGDVRPGFLHPELSPARPVAVMVNPDEIDDAPKPAPWKEATYHAIERILRTFIGSRGLLTHYPAIIMGLLGIVLVLRRHWPASTKILAGGTLVGTAVILVVYTVSRADWSQAMFGPRWFIVFLPLVLFWTGAWLRRPHHKVTWAMAGLVLAFSVTVSLIGAAAPFVKAGPGQYTVAAALKKIANGERPPHSPPVQVVTGG